MTTNSKCDDIYYIRCINMFCAIFSDMKITKPDELTIHTSPSSAEGPQEFRARNVFYHPHFSQFRSKILPDYDLAVVRWSFCYNFHIIKYGDYTNNNLSPIFPALLSWMVSCSFIKPSLLTHLEHLQIRVQTPMTANDKKIRPVCIYEDILAPGITCFAGSYGKPGTESTYVRLVICLRRISA